MCLAGELHPGDLFHVAGYGGAIAIDDETGSLSAKAATRNHVALVWLNSGVASTVPVCTYVTMLGRADTPPAAPGQHESGGVA
jgi:hypothetical protein